MTFSPLPFHPTKLPADQVMVIYHAECIDGFTAAWCFWSQYGFNATYHPGVYNEPPPDVTDKHVFLVDFSYRREVVEMLLTSALSVTLIDHHKSALKDLEDVPYLQYHTSLHASGARLAWDFLYPHEAPPQLLLHVEDRDLWRFSHPNTRFITASLFSYEQTFSVWDDLMNSSPKKVEELSKVGEALERKHQKDARKFAELYVRRAKIGNLEVPIANVPHTYASSVGELLAKGNPFAACYYDAANWRHFSLRSTSEGLDVAKIAFEFGGGGHERAAGFKVPRDHDWAKI